MTNTTDRKPLYLMLAIVALGLALRLPGIGYSFYGDEQFSLLRDSKELITTTEDRFRPVFFTLLYLWRQIGFSGEVGLRLLPVIFGLLQIPVAFNIGSRLGGRKLAVAFSVLIAASPMLIEFSQELRMYSLVALCALLQVWALLRLVERESLWRWVAFVAIALLGLYTHLHYWLFLGGVALSLLRERKTIPLWKSIAAMAAVVLLYLPNIPNLMTFVAVRSGDYSAVHLPSAIPKLVAAVTVGFNYFALAQQSALGRPIGASDLLRNLMLVVLAAIPAGILFLTFVRVQWRKRPDRSLSLCYELFIVPTLLAFAATILMKQYWLQPKYIIFVAPFALLLIALLYLAISKPWLKTLAVVLGAGVGIIALLHFWNPEQYGRRENWRAATAMLRGASDSQTALVLIQEGYPLLRYYWPESKSFEKMIEVPSIKEANPAYVDTLRQLLTGKQTVFYLRWDVVQNSKDPRDILPQALDQIGSRTQEYRYNPRLICYQWRIRS
jgi:uncharacterized membrane protein